LFLALLVQLARPVLLVPTPSSQVLLVLLVLLVQLAHKV